MHGDILHREYPPGTTIIASVKTLPTSSLNPVIPEESPIEPPPEPPPEVPPPEVPPP